MAAYSIPFDFAKVRASSCFLVFELEEPSRPPYYYALSMVSMFKFRHPLDIYCSLKYLVERHTTMR
jgi:hypothetical protein